jgi:hypothetical protein
MDAGAFPRGKLPSRDRNAADGGAATALPPARDRLFDTRREEAEDKEKKPKRARSEGAAKGERKAKRSASGVPGGAKPAPTAAKKAAGVKRADELSFKVRRPRRGCGGVWWHRPGTGGEKQAVLL